MMKLVLFMSFWMVLSGCVTERIAPAFPSQVAVGGPPYLLYTPQVATKDPAVKRPLVVVLHGCLQSAQDMIESTRMNEEAERGGFFVLYPQQARGQHPMNCWRWFDRANRKAKSGELAVITKMIADVQAAHPVDPAQVYVAGLSAGGATASALLACEPGRFAGGALLASPGFGIASDETSAQFAMATAPSKSAIQAKGESCSPAAFKGRLIVLAGSKDKTVHPQQSALLTEQFTTPAEKKEKKISSIHLVYPGELPYQIVCFGQPARTCRVAVQDLDHAWSGGTLHPYSEPRGPSASELIRRFLVENEKPVPISALKK